MTHSYYRDVLSGTERFNYVQPVNLAVELIRLATGAAEPIAIALQHPLLIEVLVEFISFGVVYS